MEDSLPPQPQDALSLDERNVDDSCTLRVQGTRHTKVSSWGGAVVGFAQDLFGGSGGRTRPPRPPRINCTSEAAASGNWKVPHANGASSPGKNSIASASPNTKFRKRLHSIGEVDGGTSLVLLPSVGSGPAPTTYSSTDHNNWDSTLPLDRPLPTPTQIIQCPQEETLDDMSSLGGDYLYFSHGTRSAHNNNPLESTTANNNTTTTLQPLLAKVETNLEAQFQLQRLEMERKLADALELNSVTKELDRTAFINFYMEELERDRVALLSRWREEFRLEEERIRRDTSRRRLAQDCYDAVIQPAMDSLCSLLANTEVVLANMPLTIGAVGLSWVTQGVVWFKFTEEMVDSCQHVHYYSKRCQFQEFPGCFECDANNPYYQAALHWHHFCSSIAAIACLLFLAKCVLAPEAVWEMLKNPTTSTPAGVFCIAVVCTFAGQFGLFGEIIVIITACFHVVLAFWFLNMAFLKFRLMPDPGWFPNVVGISYAAVKTWIYFPRTGLILMTLCTLFFLATFFTSLVRVAINHKIAAPVCWIQLSAPSITLYALTLISQPTPREERRIEKSLEESEQFHEWLATYFMPLQHFFFLLCLVGLISAIHSLVVRWPTFKNKAFSPAHVAFCFPTLSHTNAIQAYRASLNSFSPIPPGSLFQKILFAYWCLFLISGTILNLVFTVLYILRIPEWTMLNLTGEGPPPAPADSTVHTLLEETGAHEAWRQPFVSPAVLEASEAGVWMRVKRGTEEFRRLGPSVRTRNVTSLGFDWMLSELELREERTRLLDWVAKSTPRQRNRTRSVPGMMRLRHKKDGGDIYGTFTDLSSQAETLAWGHTRSNTATGTSFA